MGTEKGARAYCSANVGTLANMADVNMIVMACSIVVGGSIDARRILSPR